MARLVGLRVRGDAGRKERSIARYLGRLTEREVFNRYDAERYLLLAGDLPGYKVRLALRSAGTARGEVIGEVMVVRRNAGHGRLHRPESGLARARPLGRVAARPDFRPDRARRPDHTRFLHHRRYLGAADTAGRARFPTGQRGPRHRRPADLCLGRPDLGDPPSRDRLPHPVRHAGGQLPASSAGRRGRCAPPSASTSSTRTSNSMRSRSSRDHLRVGFARLERGRARPGAAAIRATPRPSRVWRLSATAEVRQGLDLLGASRGLRRRCSPPASRPARCRRPGSKAIRPRPSCAAMPSPSSGRCRRSPSRSATRGPVQRRSLVQLRGILGRQLHRRPRLRSGRPARRQRRRAAGRDCASAAPIRAGPTNFAAEAYLFFDQAWVWNEDLLFAVGRQELSSLGGGVRAAYGDRFRLDVLVAAPLDPVGLGARGGTRLLISLTVRLWPWRAR